MKPDSDRMSVRHGEEWIARGEAITVGDRTIRQLDLDPAGFRSRSDLAGRPSPTVFIGFHGSTIPSWTASTPRTTSAATFVQSTARHGDAAGGEKR